MIDPAQADGPAVPVRSLAGAATTLDAPFAATWTGDGSLWVLDQNPPIPPGWPTFDLLRFAPGADGDVAPVQVISGKNTTIAPVAATGTAASLAGLPHNGVAISWVGFDPTVSVFTGTQSGNVKPARIIKMVRNRPNWLSQGVAADAKGRIYLGAGPINNEYGRLDVFAPNANGWAKPLISLGGMESNLQIPSAPTLAPNGDFAIIDIHVVDVGTSPLSYGHVHVFKSLFLKPGKVKALKAKAKGKKATITWKAGPNPSKTPVSYRVVIKKGKKKVASKKTTSRKVTLKRSTLPKGKLKVSVVASNVGGKSAAAKKNLKN